MGTRRHTILIKISLPLLLAMLIQAGLIFSVILFGGTTKQMKANAYDILAEKVVSRKNDLENEMIQRWSNVEESVDAVTNKIQDNLAGKNISFGDLATNRDASNALIGFTRMGNTKWRNSRSGTTFPHGISSRALKA